MMARRLLDAATAAGKVEAWSDLEHNFDDEETIASKISDYNQSLPEKYHDVFSTAHKQTTSAEDEVTVISMGESDSVDQ